MNQKLIAVLQGLGLVVLMAVLGFLAKATNLEGLVSPTTASIVAALAVALEGMLSPQGTAFFGAVRRA